jgi:hypothetical protein
MSEGVETWTPPFTMQTDSITGMRATIPNGPGVSV